MDQVFLKTRELGQALIESEIYKTMKAAEDKAMQNTEAAGIMGKYMELRGLTEEAEEALMESASYQEMKDWFLDKFPAIADFHQKREALLAKAQEKKAAKRQSEAREKLLARRAALLKKSA